MQPLNGDRGCKSYRITIAEPSHWTRMNFHQNESNVEMTNDSISHLEPVTAEWFTSIADRYELPPAKCRTLLVAAEAFDRAQACRQEVEVSGLIVLDRYGQRKVHPAVDAEKSAKTLYLSAMKSVDLDNLAEPTAAGPAAKYLA